MPSSDGHAAVIGHLRCRNASAHCPSGDEVVAAGVPAAGQSYSAPSARVSGPLPAAGHKRGGQVADALLHGAAGVRAHLCQPGRGLLLRKPQLRMGVDAVVQGNHGRADGVEAGPGGGF